MGLVTNDARPDSTAPEVLGDLRGFAEWGDEVVRIVETRRQVVTPMRISACLSLNHRLDAGAESP